MKMIKTILDKIKLLFICLRWGKIITLKSKCGREIPEGQGKSCSMCYGDIAYGKDGYYQQWVEEQERELENQKEKENTNDNNRRKTIKSN